MGRRKKADPVEAPDVEIGSDLEEDYEPRPFKEHHWSDDGPRYHVMIELPDSVVGCRHYGGFFETEDLAEAKRACIERAEKEHKTGIIHDRAEFHSIVFRHEMEVKDDSTATTTAEPAPRPKHRRRRVP